MIYAIIILSIMVIALGVWLHKTYNKVDSLNDDIRIEKMLNEMHERDADYWRTSYYRDIVKGESPNNIDA